MNLGVENKNENWDWIKVQAFDWCDNWVALFIDLDTKFMKVQQQDAHDIGYTSWGKRMWVVVLKLSDEMNHILNLGFWAKRKSWMW